MRGRVQLLIEACGTAISDTTLLQLISVRIPAGVLRVAKFLVASASLVVGGIVMFQAVQLDRDTGPVVGLAGMGFLVIAGSVAAAGYVEVRWWLGGVFMGLALLVFAVALLLFFALIFRM